MNSREIAWLHGELPALVGKGVLDADAAARLAAHYGPPAAQARRAQWIPVLLVAFGAILTGGGLMLIFAHNWEDLGRPQRAVLLVATLLAAQGLVLFSAMRRGASMAWREGSAGLLVAAVGAAVSLVGQTYHAPGTPETFYRTWLWLIVLVPYLTGSRVAAIGFWFILLYRQLDWYPRPPGPSWETWALLTTALPFIIFTVRREREAWTSLLLACATTLGLCATGASFPSPWSTPVYLTCFFAGVVAVCSIASRSAAPAVWTRLSVPATLLLLASSLFLTGKEAWIYYESELSPAREISYVDAWIAAALPCALALAALVVLIRRRAVVEAAWVLGGPLSLAGHLLASDSTATACAIAFNFWLAAAGILTLLEGIRSGRLGRANLGLLTISSLVLVRYFDQDLTLLQRGLAFLFLGLGCLLVNMGLVRRVRGGTA